MSELSARLSLFGFVIQQWAPTIREGGKGRNWQRYAERTADYAFGPAGDSVILRYQR